jgi:hypothetical protein
MNKLAATPAAPKGQGHTQARHRAPEVCLRTPAPEPGSWLQFFLAFLLNLAGLLPPPNTAQGREAAQALRELQDLIARYARGELPPHTHHQAAERRPRLPRAERRILLTPGLHAALFFTPRAAIAARARIIARAGHLAARNAATRTPVSFFGPSPDMLNHALFVTLS